MPIYDNNGTNSVEIGKLYDNNGTTSYQIGKVYDNNGTTNSLIYSADSGSQTLSVTCTQGNNAWGSTISDSYTNSDGYSNVYFTAVSCGTSYGECETVIKVGNTTVVNQNRAYTGSGFTGSDTGGAQLNTAYAISNGQTVYIQIRAKYNPNVSGQHQSTSTITFYLT